jgi:hypothetical protein
MLPDSVPVIFFRTRRKASAGRNGSSRQRKKCGSDPAMIGKISPHGKRVEGLIYYLFGPGRRWAAG